MTSTWLNRTTRMIAAVIMAAAVSQLGAVPARAASEIKVVVNNQAITSVDIARRVALLRLQRTGGKVEQKAREQLIEEALKMQEAQRLGAVVPDAQIDASFARFAKSNNMTAQQMSQILSQAGVTANHFKQFIRVQMTWPRVVRARYGSAGQMSTQDLVTKMLEKGGEKPSTTEYILQQVIFVVPQSKRSNAVINARKREADQLRARFAGCDSTRETVKGLRDVTVRELGRVLQPQLPGDWKQLIESTSEGKPTGTRITDRGVEFVAICSAKTVSDDVAAAMVFEAEKDEAAEGDDAKKYLDELRTRAVIANR